jgi:VWFA-related protein
MTSAIGVRATFSTLVLGGLVAGVGGAVLSAQEPAVGLDDVVSVRVVNVDVLVLDGKSRPVTDLERNDFRLLVDGREVSFDYFSAPTVATFPGGRGQRVDELGGGASVDRDRVVALYLDNDFMTPAGKKRFIRDATKWVRKADISPTWHVLASSGGKVQVLAGPTKDKDEAAAGIERVDALLPGGYLQEKEMEAALESMEEFGYCTQNAVSAAAGLAQRTYSRVQGAIDQLIAAVEHVASPGSEVTLLYASDGLPLRAGEFPFQVIFQSCGRDAGVSPLEASRYDSGAELSRLAAVANSRRVTLFSLQSSGIRAPASSSVLHKPQKGDLLESPFGDNSNKAVNETAGSRGQSAALRNPGVLAAKEANLQDSLFVLADETGGLAIFNSNRFQRELEQIVDLQSSRYSLGYSPRGVPDGRVHRIEVKVEKQGLRVVARKSFLSERW